LTLPGPAERPTTLRERQPGASWRRAAFYEITRRASHALLRLCFGLRGLGAANVPARGALVLAANHQSYLDPPSIGCVITQRHLSFIAQSGLFAFRPFAWVISMLNAVPIRGDAGDAGVIKGTLARLGDGHAVLIFPEGSRCDDGEVADFKRGVALLVKRAKCPVMPVAIAGAYEAWPNSKRFPRLFRRGVVVKFGTPIPHEELMRDGPDAALARLRREVLALFETIRRR
jgi:1-acyl-sn-glycerol-3-phosphate acyltransferase